MTKSQPGADLFGPAPGDDPLAYYHPPDAQADIFAASGDFVAAGWRKFAAGLAQMGQGDCNASQSLLDRHVEDLGLAFRLTGDEQERPWPLNPMPIIIGADEWRGIEQALIQRAELLELVIADLYGDKTLVSQGKIPAAIVSGSANFARRMVGMRPTGGKFLHICSFDLARGPTGEWRVLADRVRLPVGIGYALENRLALGRSTGGLLASIGTRRQAGFFDALRQGIAANCRRADPRIALLTPGRFNQSYPEQAHLARQLGFSLVEGRDLVVRDNQLYMRTIAGLKRIDAVWRWIGARNIDPLHFDASSQIGVPNLVEACAHGLVMANWPGVGVVESRAMPAFLPRLSRDLLGEPLKLPNAATWWCGGEVEREHVLANMDRLVISSAFRQPVPGLPGGHTREGASLSQAERETIVEGMRWRPMDYTAQEIVSLSTTPSIAEGRFEPRAFTLRAFLARDESGDWVALSGGFARVSQSGELRTSLMGLGDISTDVCIIDREPPFTTPPTTALAAPQVRRAPGLLSSQAADNLYWLGRYGERTRQTARVVRALLDQAGATGAPADGSTTTERLTQLLRRWGAIAAKSEKASVHQIVATALGDEQRAGSISTLAERQCQIALLLRDRLTRDSWRVLHRPLRKIAAEDSEWLTAQCDIVVERYAAFLRLTSDSMSRSPAWRFFSMGTALERASMVLQSAQAMIPGSASAEDLSALLDLIDAQALYRSRYLAMPYIAPVLDMVLLDPAHPRGMARQIATLEEHLGALPSVREDGLPEEPYHQARQLRAHIEALEAHKLDAPAMNDLRVRIGHLSDAISRRYFLEDQAPGKKSRTEIEA